MRQIGIFEKVITICYHGAIGGQSAVAPPVPIPNTEVKRRSADDTWGASLCGK